MQTERPLRRSTPGQLLHVAIRLVLACGLLVGWAGLLGQPRETGTGQLLDDVRSSRTTSVTVEQPLVGAVMSDVTIRWSTGLLQSWTTRYATGAANGDFAGAESAVPVQLRQAAASAPRPVAITTVRQTLPHSYTDWRVVSLLLTLVLLVAGPDPSLATRWAWFWLGMAVPVSWAVFLLAEPWFSRGRTGRVGIRRLTGGWALLLGLVIAGVASAVLPEFRGVLFSSRGSS